MSNSSSIHVIGKNDSSSINAIVTTLGQTLCVLVSVTGIIGNLLVLIIYQLKRDSLKTYEIFIVSLAVADLLGTLVYPTIEFHTLSGGSFRGIGTIGCNIVYFLSSGSIYVSSLTLIMVSVDRYIAVTWPFKRRKKICRIMIGLTWSIGLSCAGFAVIPLKLKNLKEADIWICVYADKDMVTARALLALFMQNVMPASIMSILYCLIIYEIRKSNQHTIGSVSSDELLRRRKHIRKTTKVLFFVVIVFFVCITPHNIFYLLYHFYKLGLSEKMIRVVYSVLSVFMMINSCVNPLIYGKLHQPFRKDIANLFSSFFRSASSNLVAGKSYFCSRASKTLKTSLSNHDPEYIQMEKDYDDNLLKYRMSDDSYRRKREFIDEVNMVTIQQKVVKQTSLSGNMPSSWKEQMNDDYYSMDESVSNDSVRSFSWDICIENLERETVL